MSHYYPLGYVVFWEWPGINLLCYFPVNCQFCQLLDQDHVKKNCWIKIFSSLILHYLHKSWSLIGQREIAKSFSFQLILRVISWVIFWTWVHMVSIKKLTKITSFSACKNCKTIVLVDNGYKYARVILKRKHDHLQKLLNDQATI
jgi:hypothetical protein